MGDYVGWPNPGLAQFAFSVSDLPRAARLYCDALGCLKSRGLLIWGDFLATLQRVPDPAATLWWAVDRQDYVQLELWQYSSPAPRAKPLTWRACDIGYTRTGIHVDDFEDTLARLAATGITTITPPVGATGDRRAAFRDPDGFVIELFERDPVPDAHPSRWEGARAAVRSVSLSVPDLAKARRFWIETLQVPEVDPALLHTPGSEVLWGLEGAHAGAFLLRAGDGLIEVQQYLDPEPKPRPERYLLSDIGILNVALGYRDRAAFDEAFARLLASGYTANVMPPSGGPFASSYVNDDQGFSLEMFYCDPSLDERMGFTPEGR